MEKEKALELWLEEMGDNLYAYDFSGKKIKQTDYNVRNEVGWVVAYIKPVELGGRKDRSNSIVMHHRTADEKGLHYPDFAIDHNRYIICHDQKGDFYYIEECLEEEDD
mgnify:CR=1 FL=1